MEHPLFDRESLTDLSVDELQNKISDLYRKRYFMLTMNKVEVAAQINMVLETYNSVYQKKVSDMLEKQMQSSTISVQKK